MKDTTIIAGILALMVILIAFVLIIFALDSPQREIPMGSEPPGAMGGGGQIEDSSGGHGEGDPVTNQNDTYVSCKKDVCNVTVIPWVTPTLSYATVYYVAGGGGGAAGYMWTNSTNYTILVGSGGSGGAGGTWRGST